MLRFLLSPLLLILSIGLHAEPENVTFFQGDERYHYETELLQHVLKITSDEFGPATTLLKQYKTSIQGLRGLKKGEVDIAFLSTSQRHESSYLAIKVPLLQGMLGYRLLLINKSDKEKFNQIETLDSLRKEAVAGFGLHWEDLRVLYHNKLPVIANTNYKELFQLLSSSQVDYLPRGLNEIYKEIESQKESHPNIILCDDIALYYPFVRYFFVHKENKLLAKRLEKGLAMAKSDGSFEALFKKHFGDIIQRTQQSPQRVIRLANPFLPHSMPKLETSWWLPSDKVGSLK